MKFEACFLKHKTIIIGYIGVGFYGSRPYATILDTCRFLMPRKIYCQKVGTTSE